MFGVISASQPFTHAAAAATACPGGASQCVTVTPSACPHDCPVVVAGPTVSVSSPGATQYVYLSLSNFPPGDSARIAYCPTPHRGQQVSIVSDPNCGFGTYEQAFAETTVNVPIGADGTAETSFPVPYVPSGAQPIASAPVTGGASRTSFLCDDGPDDCALEVTDDGPGIGNFAQDPDDTTANTAIVPVTYFNGSDGCPGSDPLLNTNSSYSLETLIPAAVESTCKGAGGVVALNTVDDSETTVSNYAGGGADLAFTDDPGDPADAAALKGKSVMYIPVALSASVVSYLGAEETEAQGTPFALNSYDLTPDMVAGIIDSAYSAPYGSDLVPVGDCSQIVLPNGNDCSSPQSLDAFDYLDQQSAGMLPPAVVGSFMSSVAMGSSAQVTQWLCQQPNAPFTVAVTTHGPIKKKQKKPPPTTTSQVTVSDQSAASTLTSAPPVGQSPVWPPAGDPNAPWIYPTCGAYHTLPEISSTAAQFNMPSSPDLQAKGVRGFAYGGGTVPPSGNSEPPIAFSVMDWSQSTFNGLNVASLQNASGAFVQPSPSSITAALNDATPCPSGGAAGCPAGTYTFRYDDTSTRRRTPCPSSPTPSCPPHPPTMTPRWQSRPSSPISSPYSHSGGSVAAPVGLRAVAGLAVRAGEFRRSPPSTFLPPGRGRVATAAVGPDRPGAGGGVADAFDTGGGPTGGVLGAALAAEEIHGSGSGGSAHHVVVSSSFASHVHAVVLAVLAGAGRWKYLLLFSGAAVALLVGPTLLAAPNVRRRLTRSKKVAT